MIKQACGLSCEYSASPSDGACG